MRFRKFNRKQKECILAHGLQRSKWYLIQETEFSLIIYNPESKQRLWIDKFRKFHKKERRSSIHQAIIQSNGRNKNF